MKRRVLILRVGHNNEFVAPGGGNLNKPVFKTAKRPEVAMGWGEKVEVSNLSAHYHLVCSISHS